MFRPNSGCLIIFCALLFSPFVFAATDHPVGVTSSFVSQADAPLQITSMTKSIDDQIAEITVENKSSKAAISFQIEWVVAVPAGCSTQTVEPPTISQAQADRVRIEKGASASTKSYGLSTPQLVTAARNKGASLVVVQVRIARVDFEDGSSWLAESAGPVFDEKALQSHSKKCSNGQLVPHTSLPKSAACTTGPTVPENQALPNEPIQEATIPNYKDCYFVCTDDTTTPIYCQNHVTYCTLIICSNKQQCPNQECFLICP
jgi:hypothetical protein